MKKFLQEFKKFISRGNVIDMAVGMIIGAAFTAIVTAMANGVLRPIVNYIIFKITGAKSQDDIYTYLTIKYVEVDGVKTIDLANSIYIDWGTLITAIFNFLCMALILFLIVKLFNKLKDHQEILFDTCKRAEYKLALDMELTKKEKLALEEKKMLDQQAAIKAEEEKRKALEEASKKSPEVILLEEIRDLLKNNNQNTGE